MSLAASLRTAGPFVATAAQTDFACAFPAPDPAAICGEVLSGGVVIQLTSHDIEVVASTSSGFTARLVEGRGAGDEVVILSRTPLGRSQTWISGAIDAQALETDFNGLAMQVQEVSRDADLALKQSLLTGTYDAGNRRVSALAAGVDGSDAATLAQLRDAAASFASNAVGDLPTFATRTALQLAHIAASVDMVMVRLPIQTPYVHAAVAGAGPGKLQSADGQWWILAGPPYYVEQFGDIGTGAVGDSAALTAALLFASASGSSLLQSSLAPTVPIFLRTGHAYDFKDVVCPSFAGVTTAGAAFGLPSAVVNVPAGAVFGIGNNAAVNGCAVTHIYFRGPGAAVDCKGVYFASLTRGAVTSNKFDQFGLHAILVDGGIGTYITDNDAQNCLIHRASIVAKTGVIDVGGTDHFIERNEATPSLGARSSASLFFCGLRIRGANHNVHYNKGELADVGIRWEADTCRSTNNNGELCWGPGGENTGSSQFANNTFYDNSQHQNGLYSAFVNTGNGSRLDNNTAYSARSAERPNAHKYGFEDLLSTDSNKSFYGDTNKSDGHTIATYKMATFAGSAAQTPKGPPKTLAQNDTTPDVDNYGNFTTNNTVATPIGTLPTMFNGQDMLLFIQDTHTTLVTGTDPDGPNVATPGGTPVTFSVGDHVRLYNNNNTIVIL